MVYKSMYLQLAKDKLINLTCDNLKCSVVWDYEEKLHRAPLLLTEMWFTNHEQAINYLQDSPVSVTRAFRGFMVLEEEILCRAKSVVPIELKAVDIIANLKLRKDKIVRDNL